jgi:hypothetical protein
LFHTGTSKTPKTPCSVLYTALSEVNSPAWFDCC